ncbi:PREDICTED: uncharacterized protein LOC107338609 [Acropora digitifera]|uniref:uncharacterized protein LOC107338609 n=1 Tax=Acropora digitifera TaxID=70779 RepID=UPI00077A6395|nr:PREDICTED: uncharacterized protein LOC107338609 [Acropora digitifera]
MFSGFIFPGDLTVSLIVFSGRPNPKWKILSTNPGYKGIVTMLQNAKNAKLTYRPVDMPARLGYKGFLVQSTMKKESDLIVGPKTATLQKLLLKTMPAGIISKAKLQSVSEEINQGKVYAKLERSAWRKYYEKQNIRHFESQMAFMKMTEEDGCNDQPFHS